MCEWNGAAQPARLVGWLVRDCETAEVGSRHRHTERKREIKLNREKEISLPSVCFVSINFLSLQHAQSSNALLFKFMFFLDMTKTAGAQAVCEHVH